MSTTTKAKSNGKATKSKSSGSTKKGKQAGKGANDSMLLEFFTDELKDIYWAEKHLVKTLPKMQKAATSQELQDAIADHLEVTKTHVTRLEQVFEMLGEKAQAKKCDAMAGITEEGDGIEVVDIGVHAVDADGAERHDYREQHVIGDGEQFHPQADQR